jgi:hypothetical protein
MQSMSTLNPTLAHQAASMPSTSEFAFRAAGQAHGAADTRRAASLRRTVNSKLLAIWHALERFGQRRAASELLLTAGRIQGSRPELAAHLRAMAREARTY